MVSTAKNTIYLLIAYIYQKLIALFYFIILARFLGADNFGKYTFALSFTALFSVLIDFGLLKVLTREIARDKEKTKKYFGNVLSFCLLAGLGSIVLMALVINLLGYPVVTKNLVYLTSLVIFLDTLALSFYFVFRGHLNTKYEAIGIMLHKTVMLVIGLFLVYYLKANLILMILPLLGASLFYLSNAIIFLKKKIGLWPIPRFDKKIIKSLLKLSWPFFIAAIFAKLYSTSDTILLSYLTNDQSVGFYNAALKLTNAFLLLIAGSLDSALYPSLSYYYVRSKQAFNKIFTQAVSYLMLLTIPLVFGFIILSKQIIFFIYGPEYSPAILVLVILSCSIPFMFLDFIVSGLLNACEKQKTNTLIHGIGVGIFIILNFLLIPHLAHYGSALSVFFGFLIIFILEVLAAKKVVEMNKKYLLKKIGLIFFSSVLMGLVLILIKNRVHILISVIVGAGIYFTLAYLFNLIEKKDILFLKNMIKFKSLPVNNKEK